MLLTRPGAPFGPIDLTWHRIQVNRDLYVGLDPSYPPFAEWTPERIEGIEADIAREIARRDVEPQLLIMGYDGLYDALCTGYVDSSIAGLRPSAAHNEWVYYSALLRRRADPRLPGGCAHRTHGGPEGKTVAVELASAGDVAARRWSRRLDTLHITHVLLPGRGAEAVADGEAHSDRRDEARGCTRRIPGLRRRRRRSRPYVIAMREGKLPADRGR